MPRFRKKPVVIKAVQYTARNLNAVLRLAGETRSRRGDIKAKADGLRIWTLEGWMTALPGDWIIKGIAGEIYPCKPDIFEATYEPVQEDE